MSSNQVITGQLDSGKQHFEFEVEVRDPPSGVTFQFPCEIDTGCTEALMLPDYCHNLFNDFQGRMNWGGAGQNNSPFFSADIVGLGGMDLNFSTYAHMALDTEYDYGLVGIELLKRMTTKIYDDPDTKKMDIEDTYI